MIFGSQLSSEHLGVLVELSFRPLEGIGAPMQTYYGVVFMVTAKTATLAHCRRMSRNGNNMECVAFTDGSFVMPFITLTRRCVHRVILVGSVQSSLPLEDGEVARLAASGTRALLIILCRVYQLLNVQDQDSALPEARVVRVNLVETLNEADGTEFVEQHIEIEDGTRVVEYPAREDSSSSEREEGVSRLRDRSIGMEKGSSKNPLEMNSDCKISQRPMSVAMKFSQWLLDTDNNVAFGLFRTCGEYLIQPSYYQQLTFEVFVASCCGSSEELLNDAAKDVELIRAAEHSLIEGGNDNNGAVGEALDNFFLPMVMLLERQAALRARTNLMFSLLAACMLFSICFGALVFHRVMAVVHEDGIRFRFAPSFFYCAPALNVTSMMSFLFAIVSAARRWPKLMKAASVLGVIYGLEVLMLVFQLAAATTRTDLYHKELVRSSSGLMCNFYVTQGCSGNSYPCDWNWCRNITLQNYQERSRECNSYCVFPCPNMSTTVPCNEKLDDFVMLPLYELAILTGIPTGFAVAAQLVWAVTVGLCPRIRTV